MKTALVTGATGFIGHHLCNKLYNSDYNVIAVGTKDENKPLCHQFIQLNLDGISWHLIPSKIDVCFHQAANNNTTDLDSENMFLSNLTAPINLFNRLFKEKKCTQFVYASSCSVYGNQSIPYNEKNTKLDPLNPYAKSKVLFEQFAENFSIEHGVRTIGLRYSNVFGSGEQHKGKRSSMISQLLNQMTNNKNPKLFKFGEQSRDWVYVDDVVEANLLASQYKQSGIMNVGSGMSIDFNLIVKTINEEIGSSLEPEYIDCPFLNQYQSNTLVDLEHANKTLGYFPKYKILDGIKHFIKKSQD